MGGLRVHRQHDDAVAFELAELAERLFDGRFAVAHRDADGGIESLAFEARLERCRKRLVRHKQRRALWGPDLSVLLSRRDASLRQDGQMEDEPPDETIHGCDVLVHEKLC